MINQYFGSLDPI